MVLLKLTAFKENLQRQDLDGNEKNSIIPSKNFLVIVHLFPGCVGRRLWIVKEVW